MKLVRIGQNLLLRAACAEVEAPSRCVREGMVEDIQRSLMLVKDELEVLVGRGVGDRDGHQVRGSTPEQSHCDAVVLPGREFRAPGFVSDFEHREILS